MTPELRARLDALGLYTDTHEAEPSAGADPEPATATFSPTRRYRYHLDRTWAEPNPGDPWSRRCVWVMCNPSTADAFTLDPTLTRCRTFSKRFGCYGMDVLNVFAYRATDPRVMKAYMWPTGDRNEAVFRAVHAAYPNALWVCGWGVNGAFKGRDRQVRALLAELGIRWHALDLTAAGHPRHPLYLRGGSELMEMR